jgi:hypothetical protein
MNAALSRSPHGSWQLRALAVVLTVVAARGVAASHHVGPNNEEAAPVSPVTEEGVAARGVAASHRVGPNNELLSEEAAPVSPVTEEGVAIEGVWRDPGTQAADGCPSSASGYEQNTDFKGNDLAPAVQGVTTAAECCAHCVAMAGCNAVSFGPFPRYGCRLKRSDLGREPMPGRVSCLVHPDPPTPPPPPPPPPVREIHMVASNHFDGGCKIRGCQPDPPSGWHDPLWPLGCALTMNGLAQPHAYHVLNRYVPKNHIPVDCA